MLRTIFSKMVTFYMSILLGSLLLIGLIFSNAFKSYFINYTEKVMIKQAKQIVLEYEKATVIGIIDMNQINFEIQVLDKYLDASTWIVDKEGKIIIVSGEDNKCFIGQSILHKALEKVYEKEVVRIESGFEQFFNEPVLSIGYPILLNNNVQRALFIHTPMPEVMQIIEEVRFIFLKVLGLFSLIAFLGTYILSLYITMPIKQMNQAAKVIAGGDFERRIDLENRSDEIGQLASSFNNMAEELDKLEEMRTLFIANISHDLRTPLTSVKGFIQAIMDGTIPPESQNQYLQIVLNEAERMNKMTNDILDLTKVESSIKHLEKESFDFNILIKEALIHFEPMSRDRNIHVEVVLAEEETWVSADREQMIRVLHNLLENAFKFVEDKGLILVETTYNGDKVHVAISNSGGFIPKEDIPYIWDRFHKVDRSRGKDKIGTGLGLAIVKGIMRHHQEEIWVVSEEEKLTTFIFSLSKSMNRI